MQMIQANAETLLSGTEHFGIAEFAGLEFDGQDRKGGNWLIGIWRTAKQIAHFPLPALSESQSCLATFKVKTPHKGLCIFKSYIPQERKQVQY